MIKSETTADRIDRSAPLPFPHSNHPSSPYDVVILGGGLAGLTLALHCRKEIPAARILILEKNSHPVPEAAFKVGESTVEVAAHYFGQVLGLEEHIRAEQLPKNGLRFFFVPVTIHGSNLAWKSAGRSFRRYPVTNWIAGDSRTFWPSDAVLLVSSSSIGRP